jgi:hypothetical protein
MLRIALEGDLVDCITLGAGTDKLEGGEGNDRIVGDSRVQAAAMAGSLDSGAQLALELHALAGTLNVESAGDQAWGGAGDDVLAGDNELLLAGLVFTGELRGTLVADIDGLLERVAAEASRDKLDGGDGQDRLIGDQLVRVAAVLDLNVPRKVGGGGAVDLDIGELVARMDLRADRDELYGGGDADELLGDSRAVVAAFIGAFGGPLGTTIDLTGDRLVLDLDLGSQGDKLRGGDADDVLAGDNDLVATLASLGSGLPNGSYGMAALIRDASAGASSDDLNGEAGDDLKEDGNRAVTPRALVSKAKISSVSKVNAPSEAPVIDWNQALAELAIAGGNGTWVEGFVNGLGGQSNPNARIRIKL